MKWLRRLLRIHEPVGCWCRRQSVKHHDCVLFHPNAPCPYEEVR